MLHLHAVILHTAQSFSSMGAGNEVDISGKPPSRQWIAGIYFTVMMVTTVGLGDIKACTPAEEALASFQMLLGVFLFGLIVSTSQYAFLLLFLFVPSPCFHFFIVRLSGGFVGVSASRSVTPTLSFFFIVFSLAVWTCELRCLSESFCGD